RAVARRGRPGHGVEGKLALPAAFVLRPSARVSHREHSADRVYGKFQQMIEAQLDARLVAPERQTPAADLTRAGGIRADTAGILLGRGTALEYARVLITDQRRVGWCGTVMSELVHAGRRA